MGAPAQRRESLWALWGHVSALGRPGEGGLWGESGRQDFLGPPRCWGPAAVLTDRQREANELGARPRLQHCREELGSDTRVVS